MGYPKFFWIPHFTPPLHFCQAKLQAFVIFSLFFLSTLQLEQKCRGQAAVFILLLRMPWRSENRPALARLLSPAREALPATLLYSHSPSPRKPFHPLARGNKKTRARKLQRVRFIKKPCFLLCQNKLSINVSLCSTKATLWHIEGFA